MITWNLDHFLKPLFKIEIEFINIHTCKLFQFIQYFSLQSSGLLLATVCVDRYFSVISTPGSFISKLPFGTVKSATIISSVIVIFIALLNSYMLILDRAFIFVNHDKNITISNKSNLTHLFNIKINTGLECYQLFNGYKIYPEWENVHIAIYPIFTVIIMIIFNGLLITKTIGIQRNKTTRNKTMHGKGKRKATDRKMMNITMSLLFIAFIYAIMCLPGSIMFRFFSYYQLNKSLERLFHLADSFSFMNRSSMFFNCVLSNIKFRRCVLNRLARLKFWKKSSDTYVNNRELDTFS